MKVIMTIKKGNKDPENFTRELDMTPQECEYLKEAHPIKPIARTACIPSFLPIKWLVINTAKNNTALKTMNFWCGLYLFLLMLQLVSAKL